MAAIRYLGLVMRVFTPLTNSIWCSYFFYKKVGWNRLCNLKDMLVSMLCEFGLKLPILCPLWESFFFFGGDKNGGNENFCSFIPLEMQ